MLRYKSEGELHKDFHALRCATLHYLVEKHGQSAIEEILRNTAQNVYKTMHEGLKKGDCTELCEFWEYYFSREGGDFAIERLADGVRLAVNDCPVLRQLVRMGLKPDEIMCDAAKIFNDALAEGSPYSAELKKTGVFSCEQIFKRRAGK